MKHSQRSATDHDSQENKDYKDVTEICDPGLSNYPKRSKTFVILLLFLLPFSLGLKISLLSRDKYIRGHFPEAYFSGTTVPDVLWGVTNSFMPIGGCIGALGISPITNKIGRKYATLVCMIIGLMGEAFFIASYFSQRFALLALSRLFDGISSGGSMNVGLCYFFDILPSIYAPVCKMLVQFFLNLGIVISALFSLDSIINGKWIITAIPVTLAQLACFLAILLLPESPQYVYESTRDLEKTRRILIKLRGANYGALEKEANSIRSEVEKKTEMHKVSVMEFLSDKSLAASILVMSVVQLSQQLSGINAIIFYANNFMRDAKFDQEDLGALLVLILCLVGSTIFTKIIPKFGGRVMLLVGYGGMTISFVAAFTIWKTGISAVGTVVCLGAFLFIFQAGPGPVPWVITMETYTPHHRLPAQGFFTFLNWGANTTVSIVYMWASGPLGFYVSLVFAALNASTFLFLFFFMVEPLSKTQEQIMRAYQKKLPFFYKQSP